MTEAAFPCAECEHPDECYFDGACAIEQEAKARAAEGLPPVEKEPQEE